MDEGVLEAARSVRPYLKCLVGESSAEDLDTQLAGLLARASQGEDVTEAARALLYGNEATAEFLEEVLADAPEFRPPAMQPAFMRPNPRGPTPGGYGGLPGDAGPIHAGKYACPKKSDYVWYRPSVGTPVEFCPTCKVMLERVQE
jgi:hypothetical protein